MTARNSIGLPKRNVPLGDINFGNDEAEALRQVIARNRISSGPETSQLENWLAKQHQCDHAIFMASGTCALHVALTAAKEKLQWDDGDEVIVPATTFIATLGSVIAAGLTPVLADVSPDDFNITANDIQKRITGRTRAVLVVHLLGRSANMPPIAELCQQRGIAILEDCCEAVGVSRFGQPVGTWGIAAAISTYVCHHITAGVGGAVLTSDPQINDISRSLMAHGRNTGYLTIDDDDNMNESESAAMVRTRYSFVRWGFNYRMTEMEAAIGNVQSRRFTEMSITRRIVQTLLEERLKYLSGQWFEPQKWHDGSIPLFFPMVLRDGDAINLATYLETHGIETRPMMPLLNQMPVKHLLSKQGRKPEDYPVSLKLCRSAMLIGCHPGMGPEDASYVARHVGDFFGEIYPDQDIPENVDWKPMDLEKTFYETHHMPSADKLLE